MKTLLILSSLLCALIATPVAVAQTADKSKAEESAKPAKAVQAKSAKGRKADVKKRGVKAGKKGTKECSNTSYCE